MFLSKARTARMRQSENGRLCELFLWNRVAVHAKYRWRKALVRLDAKVVDQAGIKLGLAVDMGREVGAAFRVGIERKLH
jgi:hypothetical protein